MNHRPFLAATLGLSVLLSSSLVACMSAPPANRSVPFEHASAFGTPSAAPLALQGEEPAAAAKPDLAAAAQNPIAAMISLPLQNNTDFGVGPEDAVVNTLNIQPVWPFGLNEDWNFVTRTILPVVYQGETVDGIGSEFGLGDANFTGFFSPKDSGELIWGVGPQVLIPTSTDDRLGAGEWGLGAGAVALMMPKPWVIGALVSNVWSFEGNVNVMTIQPFINYNLSDGWYLNTVPIITANWEADSDDRWKIPLGAGVGKIAKIGQQPINLQVGYYNYVESPENGPDWQLRVQLQFLFPK